MNEMMFQCTGSHWKRKGQLICYEVARNDMKGSQNIDSF